MVEEFIASYARLLVSSPQSIRVDVENIDNALDEITIYASSEDIGKLIGKEGRMINSIKTFISGCKAKGGKNYRINVKPL
ncbi:MAG: RNA-binding protein [Sulfurovum sp. FS08-3]|nr:MAG: RNA-binding protein [Sulfurovum sp. FS08-3]